MNLFFSPLSRGFGYCCALFVACLLLATPALRAQSPADTLAWTKVYDRAANYQGANMDSLLGLIHEARNLAWKLKYDQGKARAYLLLGRAYVHILQQPAVALAYYDSAEVLITQYNLPHKGDLLLGKASAHETLGRYGTAANELLQMIRLMETPPVDTIGLMSSLSNMGQLAAAQRDFDAAKRYARRALALSEAYGNFQRTNILNALFNMYHLEDKQDSALFYMKLLYPFAQQQNNPVHMLIIEQNYGALLDKMNKPEEARLHLEEALRLSAAFPQREERIDILTSLGHTYLASASNNPRKGIEYAKQSEALIDSLAPGNWQLHCNLFETLAFLYRDAGDFRQAMHYMELAYIATDSLFQTDQRNKVAIERENYEVTKRDGQIAALATQQAISSTQRNWGLGLVAVLLVFGGVTTVNARRRRTLNRKLAEVNTDLLATNATKDRIMSILSHDLRSPLSTLDSFLQLSREYDMPPAQRERAERQLSSQLQSTLVMLDNLLRWSLMQVKGKAAQPASIAVKETVEHAIEPLLGLAELKSLTLNTQLPENLVLHADRDMAVFMVRNLVANAIKFSPAGAEIQLQAKEDNGLITITIQDHGPGMDAAKIATLFSMQANTSTTGTAKEKGTGIGLPLAAEMAAKNGGSLTVISQPGAGSTFTLTLLAG